MLLSFRMRIRGSHAKGLVVALILTLIPITAFSAQKITPGSTCKVYKQKVTNQNKVYTCIKSGKKLVWSKSVTVVKSTPTPTPTPTPTFNNLGFSPSQNCKLKYVTRNLSDDGPDDIGFPNESTLLGKHVIRTLGLFVDFRDAVGDMGTMGSGKSIANNISSFYKFNSYGKVNFQWTFSSKFYTLPHDTGYYHFLPGQWLKAMDDETHYLQDAINVSDPDFDFSQFDLVILFPAKSASFNMPSFAYPGTHSGYFWKIYSKEGQVRNMQSVMAEDFNRSDATDNPNYFKTSWVNIVHEIGHEYLLPDLYESGSAATFNRFMGIYDIMTGYFDPGAGLEFNGWSRWLVGFLDDNEVLCITDKVDSSIMLRPIESQESGEKIAVITIDTSRALLIESRRNLGFDSNLRASSQGVLVFLLDTSIANGKGPLRLLRPDTSVDMKNYTDAALKTGQSLTFEDYTIKNLLSGTMGDYIKITKS